MRLVIQRVNKSCVFINNQLCAQIGKGLLTLVGIEEEDTISDVEYLCHKLVHLRIFADADNKMNLDIIQVKGELLIVSQFTLFASTKKGNRPSFIKSANPEKAVPLYEYFIETSSRLLGKPVKTGVFGADMKVELINDGPVTLIMDSKNRE